MSGNCSDLFYYQMKNANWRSSILIQKVGDDYTKLGLIFTHEVTGAVYNPATGDYTLDGKVSNVGDWQQWTGGETPPPF